MYLTAGSNYSENGHKLTVIPERRAELILVINIISPNSRSVVRAYDAGALQVPVIGSSPRDNPHRFDSLTNSDELAKFSMNSAPYTYRFR